MSFTETIIEQKSMQLLQKAIEFGASDLHLMPSTDQYSVYFRKYGQLIPVGQLPQDIGDRMISYLKFLSSLDISEKRKPQSGSFEQTFSKQLISFRVSTLPSVYLKESLVVRLMLQNRARPISELSLFIHSANQLVQLVERSQGILFTTGPTGCGKSTTLYSLIHHLATKYQKHIISLEDPVENNQSDLLQIQVNERAGVTYAVGLKAILRHSPDVIMIGEIRDRETAQIAIEAALSGHLVVTTIHSKDTVGCLFRLLDLGISLEELKQTVVGVVAQRLVHLMSTQKMTAVFEILSGCYLAEAFRSIEYGHSYELPMEITLEGQIAKGVKMGAITLHPQEKLD
ncbi:competence type IV pilus ATPase ComGA [Rummeliibacillus suwonensis]|jgi:competence protein ComGA|uniref:competence type IV pilus ATPase ComGA n=1 Tax=Rummeliibacillus suwonensis TaxID=1306154 RepID=UPI0011B3CAA8|nr:competence type IV pilus ATPase ComGA [Rummeliibacillus suwonensis]MBO2535005.1 type II/IV secretion system protein [Rummeliibacillus suwonensis]